MNIYIICPVRNCSPNQLNKITKYVSKLEREGHEVHFPPRDANQNDPTGFKIIQTHSQAMKKAGRIDIFWDKNSKGSHFDLGMAFLLDKKIKLVETFHKDHDGKSFVKIMKILERK